MTQLRTEGITTLVLSVAGIQTTILIAVIGLMYQGLNKRLELIGKRLDRLEIGHKII